MKIYRVETFSDSAGTAITWISTKREAEILVKEALKDGYCRRAEFRPLEIPITKKGFIEFLNTYTPTYDNG